MLAGKIKIITTTRDEYEIVTFFCSSLYKILLQMGFLWSWNHMISRRWRTSQALDNTVLLRVLRDFKEFCSNNDDRLKIYWDHCWELKEDASTLTM